MLGTFASWYMGETTFWVASLLSFAGSLPTIEYLFKVSLYSHPSLSPDGNHFTALFTENDQTSPMHFNVETGKAAPTGLPDGCDVYGYRRVNGNEINNDISRL